MLDLRESPSKIASGEQLAKLEWHCEWGNRAFANNVNWGFSAGIF